MIHRSYTACLFCVALTAVSFVTSASKATAQITYPFEATYNSEIRTRPLTGNIIEPTVRGESADAPYGLTNLMIMNYASVDPDTGLVTFDSDPATFGLEGLPIGTLTLSGNGSDKLFGTNRGTASLSVGSGPITITGGEGKFIGATGTLELLQNNTSSPDPTGLTAPIEAQITISGSFQAVPEPKPNATIIGISAIGAGFLLYSRRNSRKRAV